MPARAPTLVAVLLALVGWACPGKPQGGDAADGEPCTRTTDCASKVCARGFCSGRPCCADGTGRCATCEAGWTCVACNVAKDGLFCSDRCKLTCSGDADCPATWACVGTRCAPKPNPTRFLFPDGGFVVRRNATAVLTVEVVDAEDGFLDGGFAFRDDSRASAPVVELPGHSVSYTFGPLDFEGGTTFTGYTRFGDPLQTSIPFLVCREAQEPCTTSGPPCCAGLTCSGSCQ